MTLFIFTKFGRTLLLTAVVVILCGSCAAMYSDMVSQGFVEGGPAQVCQTTSLRPISPGTSGWSERQCANYCVETYGRGTIHRPPPPNVIANHGGVNFCGHCIVEIDLSNLDNVGSANSADECSYMAGKAKYLKYNYDSKTGRCSADGKYEYIGFKDTRSDCIASAKQTGYNNAIYITNENKCFGTQFLPLP